MHGFHLNISNFYIFNLPIEKYLHKKKRLATNPCLWNIVNRRNSPKLNPEATHRWSGDEEAPVRYSEFPLSTVLYGDT